MKFIIKEEEAKGKFESEEKFWEVLKQGFEVEKEHSETVDNCSIIIAKIALDHLSEDVEYYTKLKKMEEGDKSKEEEPKEEEKKEDEKEEKEEEKESSVKTA